MKARSGVVLFPLGSPINAGKPWSDMDDSDLLDFDNARRPMEKRLIFYAGRLPNAKRGSRR